jgi:hypothetical protein
MKNGHFRLPNANSRKNKFVTAISMLLILSGLYATCYIFFFRTVEVDVTKDAFLQYSGESGSGEVKVRNEMLNYNQRIQEFMDSVTYNVSPHQNLSNGDIITVQASYDEDLAKRYHIKPIESKREIVVTDLPQRLDELPELDDPFYKKLHEKSKNYLDKNMKSILNEDFTVFDRDEKPKLDNSTYLYRVFLKSKNKEQKDKILDVYSIEASFTEGEQIKKDKIYYMITYNEINTSFEIRDENIYGEKIINSKDTALEDKKTFESYINKKYKKQYEITYLDVPAQQAEK